MAVERNVTVELDGGAKLIVQAEQVGPVLVDAKDIVAKLEPVVSSIEHVCKAVLDAVKKAAPSSATVELGFGLAIEQGQLITLFGKAKGDATIKVTLEWSKADDK
jgi:hypothetical protein